MTLFVLPALYLRLGAEPAEAARADRAIEVEASRAGRRTEPARAWTTLHLDGRIAVMAAIAVALPAGMRAGDGRGRAGGAGRGRPSPSLARDLQRITLTERAVDRLGIETAPVGDEVRTRD